MRFAPPPGALERQLGHLDVLRGRVVEARRDDFADAERLHLEHLFRPLVHQQHVEAGPRVVGADTLGDGLQDHRLARLGRRHDQGALALAERTENVDDAVGVVRLALPHEPALQPELLVGMDGAKAAELGPPAEVGGGTAVDRGDLLERGAPALAARAGLPLDLVAGP